MMKVISRKENFSFEVFTEGKAANAIKNLPTGKASVSNYIPVSIMKETIDAYCPKLTQIINHILKNAEITPCFKKGDKGEKENYRPVSILSNFSKAFERLIYSQLNEFMETKFSKFLTGFQKNHNTHYALQRMIENWKNTVK